MLFSWFSVFTSVIILWLLPFRYIGYRGNSHFLFFVFCFDTTYSGLSCYPILKYNFIPSINPTLWPLALSYFSRTSEPRIWWFLIGATGKGMLWAGTQHVSAAPQTAEGSGPKGYSAGWVLCPAYLESPASDFTEMSTVAYSLLRIHLQSGHHRLPSKPSSFSCVSVFRWKSPAC